MVKLRPLTPEEIHTAFKEGEQAVMDLVVEWTKEQFAIMPALEAQVQALEDRLPNNRRNSGKPPSSDGLANPAPKCLRKRHEKMSGG